MRRIYVMAGCAALLLAATALTFSSLLAPETKAGGKAPEIADVKAKRVVESGKSETAALLPVTQVVMFNSGVGYFQREGKVTDSQRIDLSFDVEDVNDLIKSMTLQDLDGGQVAAVSYDSTAPIEHTLKSFAVNLTGNPTFGAILNQARGEKVEVILLQNNAAQPANLTGSVIGVEQKMQRVKDQAVNVEVLNLWCADGMRSVTLTEVQRIRFLNAVMETEFRKALETLALGHDTQKKTVSIHFTGENKRNVRVGYVVESPIWKSSYRLVLDKEKKPFLQSWAIVENTTDEDWDDVRMALITGRPISFKMNLYDPLFINRPTVEPELFASLRPPTYTGSLSDPTSSGGNRFGRNADKSNNGLARKPQAAKKVHEEAKQLLRLSESDPRDLMEGLDEALNLKSGVSSAASSGRLGDYHRYVINHTVSLPRQKSAMIPLINGEADAERVSIFNEMTHNKFPLLGLVFKNTTGSPLMQGPITVYEGSNYAGDARILDLQKDEKRLLSYAIDLGTEVQAVRNPSSGRLTSVKIVKGVLQTNTKQQESKTYTIKNRNEDDRVMIVEHPNRTDFTLTIKEKPWETARDVHRFKVNVPAGKTEKLTIEEEKDFGTRIALTNTNDQTIKVMLQSKVSSQQVKDALQDVVSRKMKLAETQRELTKLQQQLNDLNQDQNRLRQNIRVTPKEAKVYKRWLDKLDVQEVEIDKLTDGIKKAQDALHQQQRDFDKFLAAITVE